jgi:hypothetical protein
MPKGKKMTKRQTMIYKTLQKIEQHEPHCSGVEPMYSMGVATPVSLVPPAIIFQLHPGGQFY